MTPVASSCRPGTVARRRLRWRYIGLVAFNLAAWSALIFILKACS